MAGPSADRITEWEGGSLSELVAMLQAAALPVRIDVIAPGTTDSSAGEVHLLAGGLADAFAGSLRRDDAMAALQRLEGARYVIECRLPNPESGSLSEPGPHDGSLKDRPLASLMRYCEEYVLTCRLEVWRGQDRAVISYRRGEIIGTIVGGGEGSDRLPEVLAWTDGAYEIILPAPVLPQMPSRGRDGAGARAERKRHTTLPMMPGTDARLDVQSGSRMDVGTKSPFAAAGAASNAAAGTAAAGTATARATASGPAAAPRPVAVTFASPLQPEMTTRGTPPVPAVPLAPGPAPQPAARPAMQGTEVPLASPKPTVPAQAVVPSPQTAQKPAVAQHAPQAAQKPAAPQPAPQSSQKPASQPAPQHSQKLTAPQPAPLPLQKPAVAQPAAQPQRKPLPLSVQPAPQPPQKSVPTVAQPAAQPMPKPSPPAASNDLLPASGTIEAKPKHANYLPPTTAPIQIAAEPQVASNEQPSTPVLAQSQGPKPRRARKAAQKGSGERPLRTYVFLGLAIGVGIAVAYGVAYWYLPFGHH
jgi:hypothetical protein